MIFQGSAHKLQFFEESNPLLELELELELPTVHDRYKNLASWHACETRFLDSLEAAEGAIKEAEFAGPIAAKCQGNLKDRSDSELTCRDPDSFAWRAASEGRQLIGLR